MGKRPPLPYHVIGAVLGLLVHVQALFARHLIAQHLVRLVHHLEGLLRLVHVVAILVRMHQHRQAAVLLLDVVGLDGRLQLQHLERIQIKVGGAGPQQPVDLLLGRQHRVALLDLFHLCTDRTTNQTVANL